MNFTCITIEGGLFPADLLEQVADGSAKGQKETDFGIEKGRRLSDEISAAWSDALAYWKALQHTESRLAPEDSATTPTREQWILPLLRSLGFSKLAFIREAVVVEGQPFAISHREGDSETGVSIHIEGFRTDLGKRPPSGKLRMSPHALVQEYLNRTECLWEIGRAHV